MHSIESDLATSTDINWCSAGHFCANPIYRVCDISAFGACIQTRIYLGRALKNNPANTKPAKGERRKKQKSRKDRHLSKQKPKVHNASKNYCF